MAAPVTMPRLHTAKPVAHGQHIPMQHIKHSLPTVPLHANTRVNIPNAPPTISKNVPSPTQPHQMIHPTASTRVNIPHSPPINTNNVLGMKKCHIKQNKLMGA
eukprot:5655168-Ditylum_brightwellii.AAC.1